MHKYQNNAFRVLGLLPSASTQEIMSRVSEIKVKKSLGFDVVYEYDFPWIGALDRSEENVINALQRLENPVTRLQEEMFWFWVEGKEDNEALDCLRQDNRQKAHEIWRKTAYNGNLQSSNPDTHTERPSEEAIRACLNEAILAHSSVIAKEVCVKYKQETIKEKKIVVREESERFCCPDCNKIYDKEWKICLKCGVPLVVQKNKRKEEVIKLRESDATLGDSHWKNWRFALNKFSTLEKLPGYWEIVNVKATQINDARLSSLRIEEIRGNFLFEILEVNFSFISQSLIFKDYERVRKHSGLVNGLNLSSNILKLGFNKALASQIDLLNQYCRGVSGEMSKLSDGVSLKDVLGIHSRFCSKIKDPIYEGNLVDINCISDFALARDNVAAELRGISNLINNKFHGYKEALPIMKEAVEQAASSYIKERLQKDEEIIKGNLSSQGFTSSDVNADLGKKTKPVSNKTGSLKNIFRDPFSIRSWKNFITHWKAVLVWGGIILFLIYSSSNNSSSSRSYPSSGSRSYSTSYSSSSEKERLNSEITSGKIRLATLDLTLQNSANKISALKSEIESLEAQYKYANDVPEYIQNDYNSKVEEYNALVGSSKSSYAEYEALLNETNAKINRYNALIKR